MRDEVYKKGMTLLSAVFKTLKIEAELFRDILSDLTDEEFEHGIMRIVRTEKELYPNTNIVALIRRKALERNFPSIGEAWELAFQWASNYKEIHPLVKQAAKQIGRYEITHSENMSVTRAHFIKFYEDLIRCESSKAGEKVAIEYQENNMIEEDISKPNFKCTP